MSTKKVIANLHYYSLSQEHVHDHGLRNILRCMSGYIFQKPCLLLNDVYENGNYFDATIDMPIHVFCFKLSTVLHLFGKYNIITISIME